MGRDPSCVTRDMQARCLTACRLLVLVVLTCVAVPSAAATRYDPALRFRSLTTDHFVIHYHQGEEALALRLASIVEAEYGPMTARLQYRPAARTHVVLVDQDDDPNGATTTLPYNLVEIRAVPPSGASTIGNTDDWLRLVFVHEFAHVLHLDQARGWARAVRAVFGRAPLAFPNLFLPEWQIEGLAVYEESQPGGGRLSAGDFRAVVDEAARASRFEPLDRVNGGLIAWPSGTGWYAYGGLFHQYLAERFGDQRLAQLADRTAGRFPYVSSGAFKSVFGESLGTLWREFAARNAAARAQPDAGVGPTRVTTFGYLTDSPRFDADGSLLVGRLDAHEFPSIERVGRDGHVERLTTMYRGGQIAPGRDAVYFDQLEVRRDVALVSDLYRLDRQTGGVSRLTHGARLSDPDVAPDGTRIAAIRTNRGERRMIVLDLHALEAGGDTARRALANARVFGRDGDIMATPRWSPDGSRIAVESRHLHEPSTILVFDADGTNQPHTAAAGGGRNVTPAWGRDNVSILYAHASEEGAPFNLRCVRLRADGAILSVQSVTTLPSGARSPDLSPDGRTIAFVGYSTAGQDVFTVPWSCPAPPVETPGGIAGSYLSTTDEPVPAHSDRPYRPWSTLWPRAWAPVVEHDDDEWRAGATTGGVDALGYHVWNATATWSVARSADLEPVAPGARPDLRLLYVYDRLKPSFFAQYNDETSPLRIRPVVGIARPIALREQAVDLGLALPFRRVRVRQTLYGAYRREHDTVSGPLDEGAFDRGAVRAGYALDSTKRYGYSISPEDGTLAGVTVERVLPSLGSDGQATLARGDARAYLPLGPRHAVAAVRASVARSDGDESVRHILRLGGSDPDVAVLSFEDDATSLLRGFPSAQFVGTRVALVNAEYRVPLVRIERGWGTWPVFLRTLYATGFYDTGAAWTELAPSISSWARSWGAEASADAVAGFQLPLTLTAGIGWGHDGSGGVPDTRTFYVRLGHGF
jgi:hypothetical protein